MVNFLKRSYFKEEKRKLNIHLDPHSRCKFHYTATKAQASHANGRLVCVETLVGFLSLTSKTASLTSREALHSILIGKRIYFKTTLSVTCYLGFLSDAQSKAHLCPCQSSRGHRGSGRTVRKHKLWLSSGSLSGAFIQHLVGTRSPSRTLPDELETFL